jgi:hypothetical protein
MVRCELDGLSGGDSGGRPVKPLRIMLPKIVRCECGRIVETENVLRRECRQCQEDKMRRKWRDDFANWPKRVKEPTY